jgi:hypothetical protein
LKYVGISFRTWWEWGGNKTCFKEIEVSIVFININQGQKTLNGKWYSLLNSELQSRAKIIETTTKSLPPSSHKQCSTDDTKVYCQVKFFFQHWIGGKGGRNHRNRTKYQKSHYFCTGLSLFVLWMKRNLFMLIQLIAPGKTLTWISCLMNLLLYNIFSQRFYNWVL